MTSKTRSNHFHLGKPRHGRTTYSRGMNIAHAFIHHFLGHRQELMALQLAKGNATAKSYWVTYLSYRECTTRTPLIQGTRKQVSFTIQCISFDILSLCIELIFGSPYHHCPPTETVIDTSVTCDYAQGRKFWLSLI